MEKQYSKRKIVYITLGILVGILVIAGIVFQLSSKNTLVEIINQETTTQQPIEEKVEPIWESISIELGTEVEQDINNYIKGDQNAVEEAKLDLSKINKDVVGNYEVYVNIGERTIIYNVNVVDTIAPELTLKNETIYLAQGREYQAEYFIENVYDLSGDVTSYFVLEDTTDSIIKYDSFGEYVLKIGAKDLSGNETTKTINVVVDMAPNLIGIRDVSLKKSTEYNFFDGIIALDNIDGNITEQIVINTDEVDLSTAGEYKVIYTVGDSYGIETSKTAIITVCDEEPVNDIATNSFTLDEMELLCDFGYFTYEPLKEENFDEAIKLIEPTLVSIYSSKNSGAGYIYKITPEYIYIVTEAHVVYRKENYKFVFFDKTTIEIPYSNRIALNTNKEYATNTNEIVLYRVKTSNINKNTLINLKQAYYKENITSLLYNTQKIFTYTKWYDKCEIENLIKKSTITNAMKIRSQENPYFVIQTAHACIAGQSGSPTYDYKGNLIGMALGTNFTNDYHLYIDELNNFDSRLDEFDQYE